MIADAYLDFHHKIIVSVVAGAVWIYFRTYDCYKAFPRKSIPSVLVVSLWIYANYYEPLCLPAGLLLAYAYSRWRPRADPKLLT